MSQSAYNISATCLYLVETKTEDRVRLAQDVLRGVQEQREADPEIADQVRGRVMLKHRGEWGAVCAEGWDKNDAQTVCGMLGFQ